jgi:hypothetical protein
MHAVCVVQCNADIQRENHTDDIGLLRRKVKMYRILDVAADDTYSYHFSEED